MMKNDWIELIAFVVMLTGLLLAMMAAAWMAAQIINGIIGG